MFSLLMTPKMLTNPSLTSSPKPMDQLFPPNQLAGRILDLELQCEGEEACERLVYQLASLYQQAIEFFESKGSEKYQLYQRRMCMFLKKPMIVCMLKGKPFDLASKREKIQQTVQSVSQLSRNRLQKVIAESERQVIKRQNAVETMKIQQDQKLEERISRRRAISNRSTTTTDRDQDFDFRVPENIPAKDCSEQAHMSLLSAIQEKLKLRSTKMIVG